MSLSLSYCFPSNPGIAQFIIVFFNNLLEPGEDQLAIHALGGAADALPALLLNKGLSCAHCFLF